MIKRTDDNETLSEDDADKLQALFQICEILVREDQMNLMNSTSRNFAQNLQEIQSNFNQHSTCSPMSQTGSVDFDKHFSMVVTSEGICYSYNMLDYRDLYTSNIASSLSYPKHGNRSSWTVVGYESNDPETHPERVMGSGKTAGITLKLTMEKKDVNYACKGTANGFRLSLHTADESPRIGSHFYKIPFGAETMIAVTPRVTSTSDGLRSYKPVKRQCFFPGEKRLKFFKSYTQSNCKAECFAGE